MKNYTLRKTSTDTYEVVVDEKVVGQVTRSVRNNKHFVPQVKLADGTLKQVGLWVAFPRGAAANLVVTQARVNAV